MPNKERTRKLIKPSPQMKFAKTENIRANSLPDSLANGAVNGLNTAVVGDGYASPFYQQAQSFKGA